MSTSTAIPWHCFVTAPEIAERWVTCCRSIAELVVTMRIRANILLAFTAFSALVLAWGYWYSLNHAPTSATASTVVCTHRPAGHRSITPSATSSTPPGWQTWSPRVHSADVRVGSCQLREVPVTIHLSNDEWVVWWVPLPHIGGLPRRYFDLAVAIDSRACAAVVRQSGAPAVDSGSSDEPNHAAPR